MTTDTMHRPTPEFRDFLEGEITREFRSRRSFARLRVAAVLLATLAAGTTAGLASAQIRQGAQRDSLLESANSDLYLAGLRLQLARSAVDDAQQRLTVGAMRPEQVAQVEADLRKMEALAYRARLNVDEIKASSLPPRDDLNAPLVGSHDFVTERLKADLVAAQQSLTSAERANLDVERQYRAGVVGELAVQEAALAVTQARAALGSLVEKQKLRKEFIAKGTPVDQLNRMYQEAQLRFDVMVAQEAMTLLTQRLETLVKQHAAGVASELDLLRAQVEYKERENELRQLVRQMREIRKPG